jgi:chaperonin GroEL (HSP60 family)
LIKGNLRDNLKAGVLEPAISKLKSLKAATEAAIALLRIECVILLLKYLELNLQRYDQDRQTRASPGSS